MWTYDESGGWFDHVPPPRGSGYGLRVPALLVSPYARRGFVDGTQLDTTSILRFIETNWRLAPLASRDARAGSLERALDFSRPPREPSMIAAERKPPDRRGVRIWVIYVGYGAAVVLSAILIGWAGLRRTLAVTAILVASAAPAAAQTADVPRTIQTVPAVPGMRFSLNGTAFKTDAAGRAHPPLTSGGSLRVLTTPIEPGVRARFDRWFAGRRIAAMNLEYRVGFHFVDLRGDPVDPAGGHVGRLGRQQRPAPRVRWLEARLAAGDPSSLARAAGAKSTAVYYAAQRRPGRRVRASCTAGNSASSRARAARAAIAAADVLGAVRGPRRSTRLPDRLCVRPGVPEWRESAAGARPGRGAHPGSLPRGDYRVSVDALGISLLAPGRPRQATRRWASGHQLARCRVVAVRSGVDRLGAPVHPPPRRRGRRRADGAAALAACTRARRRGGSRAARRAAPDPLFAYYYIWFNADSWNRAKTDYPLLGRYSSDDREVMRQHVEWAKQAGHRRLHRQLEEHAGAEPPARAARRGRRSGAVQAARHLPGPRLRARAAARRARVARDLDIFREPVRGRPAFDVFGKPLVIWSGTPRFTRAELAAVTQPRRDGLLILASERNVEGYGGSPSGRRQRLLLVVGEPRHLSGLAAKLAEMGAAIHARGGLWIASGGARLRRPRWSAAPAWSRAKDGDTLRTRTRRRDQLGSGRGRPHQLERVQREHAHRAQRATTGPATSRWSPTSAARSFPSSATSTRASPAATGRQLRRAAAGRWFCWSC